MYSPVHAIFGAAKASTACHPHAASSLNIEGCGARDKALVIDRYKLLRCDFGKAHWPALCRLEGFV